MSDLGNQSFTKTPERMALLLRFEIDYNAANSVKQSWTILQTVIPYSEISSRRLRLAEPLDRELRATQLRGSRDQLWLREFIHR